MHAPVVASHVPIPEQVVSAKQTTEQSSPKDPSLHAQIPIPDIRTSIDEVSHVPIPEQSFGQVT